MAQPTNLTSTYDHSNLNVEDVADQITIIDPTDTPFRSGLISMGLTEPAIGIVHEWTQDALRAHSATRQRLEGDDANYNVATTPGRENNICQINEEAAVVSSTSMAIGKYAVENTLEFQVSKHAIEITRDIEATMFANNTKVNTNETTEREAAGLPAWIETNVSAGAGATENGSGTARTDGTQRALQESFVKTGLRLCYTAGGNPDYMFCGPLNKLNIDNFQGIVPNVQVVNEDDPLALIGSVDVYNGGLGQKLKIMPNRFMRERDIFGLQMDMFRLAELMPLQSLPLAKTGILNDKEDVGTEWTLAVRQEKACFAVYDLNDS